MVGSFCIERIKARNFKSFRDLDVALDPLNIIVGKNASGKSNFRRMFSFLRDIAEVGIEEALHINGGRDALLNFRSKDSTLSMEFGFRYSGSGRSANARYLKTYGFHPERAVYKFSIRFLDSPSYEITNDELVVKGATKPPKEAEFLSISRGKDGVKVSQTAQPKRKANFMDDFMNEFPPAEKQLLLEWKLASYLVPDLYMLIADMGIYDFEPKKLKMASPARSPSKLKHDGSNLSAILYKITRNSESMTILKNYMQDLLPDLKAVSTERTADGSLKFNIREAFSANTLPATLVSDGTANILALLICLFLQGNRLSFIEEPERSIHSGLLSRLIQMMDDASDLNQLFITTHNADILDYLEGANTLLVTRDDTGSSTVTKLEDHVSIKQFKEIMLKSEIMSKNLLA